MANAIGKGHQHVGKTQPKLDDFPGPETGQKVKSLLASAVYAAVFFWESGMRHASSVAQELIKVVAACLHWQAEWTMDQAEQIANYLLIASRKRGENLTNLKLQKLLYYAQAWFLATQDVSLFDEDFKAWVHGPVLLSQYHRFKANEWRPILDEVEKPDLSAAIKAHLDEILDVFGTESAISLEAMTHAETPWREARGNIPPDRPSQAVINKESMKLFYRSL